MGRGEKEKMGRRLTRPSASTFLRVAVIATTRISLSASCGTKESANGRERASDAIEVFISATSRGVFVTSRTLSVPIQTDSLGRCRLMIGPRRPSLAFILRKIWPAALS